MSDVLTGLERDLSQRYRVRGELGRGGMAIVYLADDLKHGRRVALKVLHPETLAAIGAERFLREIDIVAGLSHPHIVPLFDSGVAAGMHFYVMPYIEGESLRARITREQQLPLDEALRLTREIASALGHAHQRGLVHRDIKPENVMLSHGLAQVADFGIARGSASGATYATAVGTVIGSPIYMSPEQASGSADVDQRSDVYSLACVLFEMLAGQPPFTGSLDSVIRQHLSAIPRPVTDLRPGAPRSVSNAISKALAKSRADRFGTAALFAEALTSAPPAPVDARSVAVLPFSNLTSDPENEYFADGITEDVIAQLSKVRSLKVISRTSVMRFKKREMTLREIGEQLGVSTVVEGSVRRAGGRVRIVAQLIDATSDEHLWADTYDRQLTDIFEIQSDVALRIVEALRAELSAKERSRIVKEPTRDVVAYQRYLMGRHRLILYTRESLRDSIEYFAQAIARDPGFALAHAATALAYTELGELGEVDYEKNRRGALQAAARALELDPELGESHSVMAFARLVFDSDWKGAEAGFRRALELNPGSADTYDLYGRLCAARERHDEAVALLERGQELDPLAHRSDLATALVKAGRFEDAAGVASRAIRLEPQDARGHATLGWALIKQGRHHEGLAALEHAVAVDSSSAMWLAQLAQALAMVGQTERAREILGRLEGPAAPAPASSYYLAYIYTGLGEHDRAMDHLERAVASSARPIYGIRGSFLLAPLREHPRFADLLKRLEQKGS